MVSLPSPISTSAGSSAAALDAPKESTAIKRARDRAGSATPNMGITERNLLALRYGPRLRGSLARYPINPSNNHAKLKVSLILLA